MLQVFTMLTCKYKVAKTRLVKQFHVSIFKIPDPTKRKQEKLPAKQNRVLYNILLVSPSNVKAG